MKPLHAIIVFFLFGAGALYWYSHQQEQHYGDEAQRYLQRALRDIGTWQRAPIQKHLAPQTLAAIDDAQLDALIERYRELGAFKRLDDAQFARLTTMLSFFGSNILLSYHGNVIFARGSASLAVTLIASDGRLQIYNFSFGPPLINASGQ